MGDWKAEVEQVRAEHSANRSAYTGLKGGDNPGRIADAMNDPREVSTTTAYRPVTISEVYDALGQSAIAKIQAAVEDYAVAANAAQRATAAAGVEFYGRLTDIGTVDVTPHSTGRASLDAAIAAGYLTAEQGADLVAVGTEAVPVKQTLWQVWGWDHSITIKHVEEALA